jgi:ubiquinone/menaquinone biosynthesis C-methylase UbiE
MGQHEAAGSARGCRVGHQKTSGRRGVTHRKVLSPEEVWRRYDGVESRLTAPLSERMLDLAGVRPGMRVLDLATGRGEPALRAARRVAPDGVVVGIELADGVLEMAREKARLSGLSNLDLRVADAASALDVPSNHFHAATVRWGLMYMAAPVAALVNVQQALLPTGVLVAALWAEPERVPYYTLPRRLLQRYRSLPRVEAEAPGPFRYADLERVTRDFGRAGFLLDHVEEMEVAVFESETEGGMVDWVRALGLTQLLNDLPEQQQRAWEDDLTSEVRRRGPGPLQLGGVTRIVRARKK